MCLVRGCCNHARLWIADSIDCHRPTLRKGNKVITIIYVSTSPAYIQIYYSVVYWLMNESRMRICDHPTIILGIIKIYLIKLYIIVISYMTRPRTDGITRRRKPDQAQENTAASP